MPVVQVRQFPLLGKETTVKHTDPFRSRNRIVFTESTASEGLVQRGPDPLPSQARFRSHDSHLRGVQVGEKRAEVTTRRCRRIREN